MNGEKGETSTPRSYSLLCRVWRVEAHRPPPHPRPSAHRPLLPPQACRDFLELAETHSRKWQRALQYEQEQRVHLEETIEQLAKQHNSLERAFRSAPGRAANPTKSFSEGEWGHLASLCPSDWCSVHSTLSLPLVQLALLTWSPIHMPFNVPTLGLVLANPGQPLRGFVFPTPATNWQVSP